MLAAGDAYWTMQCGSSGSVHFWTPEAVSEYKRNFFTPEGVHGVRDSVFSSTKGQRERERES